MAPPKAPFENLPPISSHNEVPAREHVMANATLSPRSSSSAPASGKSREPREKKISRSKSTRAASNMIDGAKHEEGEARKARKKTKTSEAATVAAEEDAVGDAATEVAPTATAEVDEEKGKKTVGARVFSEEDDIVILEGVIEYRANKGLEPSSDPDAFFDFIRGSLHVEVNKRQVMDKIRSLLKKFRIALGKYNHGKEPAFTPHDSKVFELSVQIWGTTVELEDNPVDNDVFQSDHPAAETDTIGKKSVTCGLPYRSAFDEHQKARNVDARDNGELGKGADRCRVAGKNPKPNVVIEEGGYVKESGSGGVDDFWAGFAFLKDGVETMMSQGLYANFPKWMLLETIKGCGGIKGKEWDAEWKALRMEETQLHMRKLDLVSQFSKAVMDELKK